MQIFNDIPAPTIQRQGRPSIVDFAALNVGQSGFVAIPADTTAEKFAEKVRGALARWRKGDPAQVDARKAMKFTIAAQPIPNDPLGTVGLGVWRTA